MKSKLIIIRGNSGSGKSTVAKMLQQELEETMLIPQDVLRKDILRIKSPSVNHSIQLIYEMAMYGNKIGYNVILEGILTKSSHYQMLVKLVRDFHGDKYIYYMDIPFEETLLRHQTKPNNHEFGEKEMKEWWQNKDFLDFSNEKIIGPEISQEEFVKMILSDINK